MNDRTARHGFRMLAIGFLSGFCGDKHLETDFIDFYEAHAMNELVNGRRSEQLSLRKVYAMWRMESNNAG